MKKPLISICMPVFNGERFLAYALDSLLAQDYENFEMIILDNISTDNTRDICLSYAENDSRIRYILDDIQVGVSEGHNRAASYASGEYIILACDDDVYDPSYISSLYAIMTGNQEIGMVFCAGNTIDENGAKGRAKKDKAVLTFDGSNSKYHDFLSYMFCRRPVPMIFGLFRMSVYKQALPFSHVDSENGERNVDNIFMLRILSKTKVMGIDKTLFFYRLRDRSHPPDWPKSDKYMYIIKHQARVSLAISSIISTSAFTILQKIGLQFWVVVNFLYYFYRITRKITRPLRHCAL